LNFRYFDSGYCHPPIIERTFPKVSIVFSPDQMPSKIEQIANCRMGTQESLSLLHRFESSHPTLSHPGRFMRLLRPIVRVSRRIVDYIRHQFSMGHTVASQFVRHDVPGLATTTPHKPLEEALCCSAISTSL
jgi:hypothetical protein